MRDVYFDNASTTRVDEYIADLARDIMLNRYGNPSSLHAKGLEAQRETEQAAAGILKALGAGGGRVIFTSGGTEANNLALFGTVQAKKRLGNRIVTTEIEHPSVLAATKELERQGFEMTLIPCGADGRFDMEKLANACDEKTILVSMMLVNNETGAVQPVEKASAEIRRRSPNAAIHTDAIQAFGKIPLSPKKLGVDMISVSGHKIHAPKGVGALWLAKGVRVMPMLFGGGQQEALRPGTENVPLFAALGAAAKTSVGELSENSGKVLKARETLLKELLAMEGISLNSPGEDCSPYILNISADGLKSETVINFMAERGVYISGGSACSKGKNSYVLKAMGLSDRRINCALRISLSKYSTEEDARYFCEVLSQARQSLRKF